MPLHKSGEDYLEAILVLQKKKGMVRSADVARHMDVSKPSVCHAVATLKKGGFLLMDGDHFLHLTDLGREVAEDTAERDACRIEHVVSKETFERLKATRKLSGKAVISSDES
jgi:Mn-dependent DtxR family transcriptional regulator